MSSRKTDDDREEARTLGLALLVLRRARGISICQLSDACGSTRSNISTYETGKRLPRIDTLHRLAKGIGLPLAALYETQRFIVEELMGREGEDGTLPPERRPGPSREDSLRLAQEAGKAVAHCCLAFMELQAGGWHQ